jgi:hypothetical protein
MTAKIISGANRRTYLEKIRMCAILPTA